MQTYFLTTVINIILLIRIFLFVQKSNDNSNMTVTNTPIKEPENVDPNKYTTRAVILKKKWKNATQGLRKDLF